MLLCAAPWQGKCSQTPGPTTSVAVATSVITRTTCGRVICWTGYICIQSIGPRVTWLSASISRYQRHDVLDWLERVA
jgi:hypothetical protein